MIRLTRPHINLSGPSRLTLAISILVVAGVMAAASGAAFAHASLLRAEPPPNSVLEKSPERVTIWFTEPLVGGTFSEIQVLNSSGNRVDNRDSTVDVRDRTVMFVTLPPLPRGIYTVAWRSFSTLDGHPWMGSFVFSVGEALTAQGPPEAQPPLFSSPFEPLLRWLTLLSVLTLVGGLGFFLLVAEPSLRGHPDVAQKLRGRLYALMWVAIFVLFLSETGRLLVSATLQASSQNEALARSVVRVLVNTQWGHLWLWRTGLLYLAAVAMGLPMKRPAWDYSRNLAALGLDMAILLTLSLSSHSAALAGLRAAGVFTDYAHLLAAGFWVGGIFHLATGLPLLLRQLPQRERGVVLSAMVPRFSTTALLSVGTLLVTGLYSAWTMVGILPALFQTTYGLTLVTKLALIIPLVALGALNLLRVTPRLARSHAAGYQLRRFVTVEAILAVLVLLSVGVLTSLETARQTAARTGLGQPKGLSLQATAADLRVNLAVEPARLGLNRLVIRLEDKSGKLVTRAEYVLLLLRYLGAELGATPVYAIPQPNGTYVVDKVPIGTAGEWRAEIRVGRQGFFDTQAAFRFSIRAGGGTEAGLATPAPDTGKLLWGMELTLLGTLFMGTGARGGWPRRASAFLVVSGSVAVTIGLLFVAQALLNG
ncbi:MAG: copper resistance protein CopC/CopD [Chloroflexi bacterium]|nr:copper resistance protein CopC/CopD [Chloroflexota bacterium]